MPAGREGMRAEQSYFSLLPLNFHGAGVQGGADWGGLLPLAAERLVRA